MSTDIKSKTELASLASDLGTMTTELKSDGDSLKSKISSVENYDGIDVVGAGRTLVNNIDNSLTDLDTVSTNIKNYASQVIGFDVDDFNSSDSASDNKLAYEDLFKTDGSAEGNATVIWNFFKYKGLSDAATAGILGNIQAESGFNPGIVERGSGIGYGLIQWSFGRRTALENAARQRGVDPSSLQFQLEYLWEESVDPNSSYGKSLAAAGFYDTNSPSDAAYYFHNIVEKSADSYDAIRNNRCRPAEQWYNQLKGTSAGEVGEAITASKTSGWANAASTAATSGLVYTSSSGGYRSSANYTSYTPTSSSSGGYVAPSFPRSTASRNVKIANVDYEKLEAYLEDVKGIAVKLPAGLGSKHTYMGWQCITARASDQYKLIESAGMNFDEQGFGKIGDRYVVATTTTFGNVGDFIDVVQSDGTVIKCIIGDIKSQHDANCNKWGHSNGVDVVEFVVDRSTWYGSSNSVVKFHPEWNKNIDTIINKGNYFDLAQKYPKTVKV